MDAGNNLYMKNLPKGGSDVEQSVEKMIREKLEGEGKITSVYVQIN